MRVIDLSADYRLSDPQVYADWYGHAHTTPPDWARPSTGCPELFRERIPPVDLIANPGCYTSTSILALAPLIAEDLVERTGIIIDAKSGVSGAGRSPKLMYHFPECNESLSAYSVGRHRHTPEIDQVLTEAAGGRGDPVEVIFTPHLVPMDRGIFATIYARPKRRSPSTTCWRFTDRFTRKVRSYESSATYRPPRIRRTPTFATSPCASCGDESWCSPAWIT